MHCPKCGRAAPHVGDPEVPNLSFGSDERINGLLLVPVECAICGVSVTQLDVEVDVQVPLAHRGDEHKLEINLEAIEAGSKTGGFPATVWCSCGEMEAKGVLILRRSN